MKRCMAVLLVLGMLPWGDLNAQQTSTTTFRVTATVVEFCDVTAPDLALGNYGARGGAALQATIPLSMTCTPNTTYNVRLNRSASRGAMRSAISRNTTGTDTVTGVGTGEEVDHTIFGRFPATQVVPAGDYADSITVRVYY